MPDEYDVHLVSFKNPKTNGYSCLSLGKGQKPEPWQIEKLREVVETYDNPPPEDDYDDLC